MTEEELDEIERQYEMSLQVELCIPELIAEVRRLRKKLDDRRLPDHEWVTRWDDKECRYCGQNYSDWTGEGCS